MIRVCSLGLYAKIKNVHRTLGQVFVCTTHVSASVIQPTVIYAHPSFVQPMCVYSLMVSLPILCDNAFVGVNEAIV